MMSADDVECNCDGDEEALKAFLLDVGCLDSLSRWTRGINVFEVLGVSRLEIRHSNMLAWLMDPLESHGLGDRVVRGFVQYAATSLDSQSAFDDLLMDCMGLHVFREWRNMDLLVVDDVQKYVLCIENKIGSGEHAGQLERYAKFVDEIYRGYRTRFVFLSPDGIDSSDPDRWIPMSYADVLEIIDRAVDGTELVGSAELLISNYMETVRRYVLGDEELSRICADIYAKHHRALDLIFENRPDKASDVAAICKKWAEDLEHRGLIELDSSKCCKSYIRFKTGFLSRVLPDTDEASSGWGTRNHYFFEVVIRDGGDRMGMQLAFSSEGLDEERLALCDRVNVLFPAKMAKTHWKWRTHWSSKSVKIGDDIDRGEIFEKLDGMFEGLVAFERKLADGLGIPFDDAEGA